jgi:dethiobiotin synthetase
VNRGVFVTGTDTGVGKTLVSCALIHALKARGVPVMPMKPIAAGAESIDGQWENEDSMALMEAAGCPASRMGDVTPILLREAMAPHIAARREGRGISLEPIREAHARLREEDTFVVAEGVGGLMVPLDTHVDGVDLARALDLPLVLVVGLRLGCLNHALLTASAIETAGLVLAGWIANEIDSNMAVTDENVAALVERISAPLLGRIPFMSQPDPRALAHHLYVTPLIEA